MTLIITLVEVVFWIVHNNELGSSCVCLQLTEEFQFLLLQYYVTSRTNTTVKLCFLSVHFRVSGENLRLVLFMFQVPFCAGIDLFEPFPPRNLRLRSFVEKLGTFS